MQHKLFFPLVQVEIVLPVAMHVGAVDGVLVVGLVEGALVVGAVGVLVVGLVEGAPVVRISMTGIVRKTGMRSEEGDIIGGLRGSNKGL